MNEGKAWHGSTNQEFVFLSDRYGPEIIDAAATLPVVEFRTDGVWRDVTGIPGPADLAP